MDVLANIRGLSFDLPSLYSEVSKQGWEIKKVKYDSKDDRFVATAKSPHGDELMGWGKNDKLAVANLVMQITKLNGARMGKLSMWNYTFTDQLVPIAEAYSKAPLYEPKAAISFMALGRDSEHRAKALMQHLEITIVNNPEPYSSPEKMFDDIRKRRKLEVSRAGLEHPIWSANQVISYRIVHDVLGHCASGGGFDWEGENRAFAAHAAIIPYEAQQALFTESIASSAYATYYRAYGPLKVALFPQFMDAAQEKENKHPNSRGTHPSLSHPPVAIPSVKKLESHVGSDSDFDLQLSPKLAAGGLRDPNEGWQSGVAPLPQNAALDYDDPLDAFPPREVQEPTEAPLFANARLIDTEWSLLNQEDPGDLAKMKQAIVNAFRVVLLSPRKDLRWNAVHYQDISHIDADESDPTVYWNALENARQDWNVARYGENARYQHMPYYKEWKQLEALEYHKNPELGDEAAKKRAKQLMIEVKTNIENKIMAQDEQLPEEDQMPGYKIELEANKMLQQWLNNYLKEHQMGFDFESRVVQKKPPKEKTQEQKLKEQYKGPGTENMFDVAPQAKPDMARYGAWMGAHLQAIAQISQHIDEILKAALYDVHDSGTKGAGWHFRSTVLSLDLPGVGPKVCSFAWLLLQPMTSQLATIDTHMMDVLGAHYEKDMNPRDYFKYERMLKAGRDAAGYQHVPLGLFQWGMWDYKRTGPGTHQNHAGMRVLNPMDHNLINWENKTQNLKAGNWPAPEWWANTEDARNAIEDDWNQNIASKVPQTAIPFNFGAPLETYSKVAASGLVPSFKHPATGEQIMGRPGETIMQMLNRHGLGLEQAWQLPDESVSKT